MAGNAGKIIKRGDCVGKEKAVVKDIGTGYVTFQVDADPDSKRPAQEHSVQLYPNGLETQLPMDDGEEAPPPSAPVVTPPTTPVVVPPKS